MLLTDVWDLLEHMAENPPVHRLMAYVAPTFGYKPTVKTQKAERQAVSSAARANAAVDLGQFKAKRVKADDLPKHLKDSANWQKIVAGMRKGEAS